VRECPRCEGWIEDAFRFCPWCAAPQRRKLVEYFVASPRIEGDAGKALRVSRYLVDGHVRFSIWRNDAAVEAVSLEEREAERLADFLTSPRGRDRLRRAAARAMSGVRPWTRLERPRSGERPGR
jgi:hypothetical protein